MWAVDLYFYSRQRQDIIRFSKLPDQIWVKAICCLMDTDGDAAGNWSLELNRYQAPIPKSERFCTSAAPICFGGVNRNSTNLNPSVISNNITLQFTMYLQFFTISWHWGHHKWPRHSSLAIRVTRTDCGAPWTVPNWTTTDHVTNMARSLQFLQVCSGSTVNFTCILFSPLGTPLIKLTEFNIVQFFI
jgi:hypothetical protein